jgi:hypothetical protein
MEANEQDAVEETPQPQPCGAVGCCRDDPWKFEPATEPRKHDLEPEIAAELDAEAMARYAEACAAIDRRTAWHEAAHCCVSACHDRKIKFVQAAINGQSCVTYVSQQITEEASITSILAGDIGSSMCDGKLRAPSREEIQLFLDKARRGEDGDCDRCRAAFLLQYYNEGATDEELIERWRKWWVQARDILDTVTARCAVSRLAAALMEKRHLSGEEAHALLGEGRDLAWAYIYNRIKPE